MNCVKCGAEMKENFRCCLRCGALNPYHPDNQSTLAFLNNKDVKELAKKPEVDNNAFAPELSPLSKILFLIVNLCGFCFSFLCFSLIGIEMGINLIVTTIFYFYFVCYQLLFVKAYLPWWGIFIPVYNIYLINKLSFGTGWFFLIPFIPLVLLIAASILRVVFLIKLALNAQYIISLLYSPFLLFFLGKRFGRSGILTILLGFIIIPVIAFSSKYQCEF